MQITYEDGGASYYVNDYFPHLHFQAGAALADESYDYLIDWGVEYQCLSDVEFESDSLDKIVNGGAVEDTSYLDLE